MESVDSADSIIHGFDVTGTLQVPKRNFLPLTTRQEALAVPDITHRHNHHLSTTINKHFQRSNL